MSLLLEGGLENGVGFEVEGNRVRFWVDDWLGIGLLPLSFPRLLQCCPINYLLSKIVMWGSGICFMGCGF